MAAEPAAAGAVVSVVVVNWNGGAHLLGCLEGLAAQTFRDFEVIVVDNGSTDGSAVAAMARFPEVIWDWADANLGFAAGSNRGAQRARGTLLATLNPDARPQPGWLAALVAAAEAAPDVAAFGSLQLLAETPDRLDGAGDELHVAGVAWRSGHGQLVTPAWLVARPIFAPCGAAAFYRLEAFRALGGFDEAFFCYVEDVDLAFRLRLSGQRCVLVPEAVVHHVGAAAAGRGSDFMLYHGHRNLVWLLAKNLPGPLLVRYLPLQLAVALAYLAFWTARGRGRPLWRAYRDALRGLPRVWRQRRVLQRDRLVPLEVLQRQLVTGIGPLIARSSRLTALMQGRPRGLDPSR